MTREDWKFRQQQAEVDMQWRREQVKQTGSGVGSERGKGGQDGHEHEHFRAVGYNDDDT